MLETFVISRLSPVQRLKVFRKPQHNFLLLTVLVIILDRRNAIDHYFSTLFDYLVRKECLFCHIGSSRKPPIVHIDFFLPLVDSGHPVNSCGVDFFGEEFIDIVKADYIFIKKDRRAVRQFARGAMRPFVPH